MKTTTKQNTTAF